VVRLDVPCDLLEWQLFSHAIANYYMRNQDLCGKFSMEDVNWTDRKLETRALQDTLDVPTNCSSSCARAT
jgi:hypothetical protein